MIKHFILLKYLPGTPASHIDEFCHRMLSLPAQVPAIESLEIGADILQEARSWDLILVMRFASIAALREYQGHPLHRAAMQFNDPRVEQIAALDYEQPVTQGTLAHQNS